MYKHGVETNSKEDPQGRSVLSCVPRENVMPYPFKILNTNGYDRLQRRKDRPVSPKPARAPVARLKLSALAVWLSKHPTV